MTATRIGLVELANNATNNQVAADAACYCENTSSATFVHWFVIVASVEERLFTAYKLYGQVTLDWDEIAYLLRDDAVATRITAKAAEEAGVEHPGADMIGGYRKGETWQQFVARVRKCCSR